jgi:hypothetical protein
MQRREIKCENGKTGDLIDQKSEGLGARDVAHG